MIKVLSLHELQWGDLLFSKKTPTDGQSQFFFDGDTWSLLGECPEKVLYECDGGILCVMYQGKKAVFACDTGDLADKKGVDAMFVVMNDIDLAWRLVEEYRPRLVSPRGLPLTKQSEALIFAQRVMQQHRGIPKFFVPGQEMIM